MIRRFFLITVCLLLCLSAKSHAQQSSSNITLPKCPVQSVLLYAHKDQPILSGKAWLTDTKIGHRSYHMHGTSTIQFDLAPLNLKPGRYQIGLIARTGTEIIINFKKLLNILMKFLNNIPKKMEVIYIQLLQYINALLVGSIQF